MQTSTDVPAAEVGADAETLTTASQGAPTTRASTGGLDDSEGEQPRGPYSVAARQVQRKKIGFNETSWDVNLELEGFLRSPSDS